MDKEEGEYALQGLVLFDECCSFATESLRSTQESVIKLIELGSVEMADALWGFALGFCRRMYGEEAVRRATMNVRNFGN